MKIVLWQLLAQNRLEQRRARTGLSLLRITKDGVYYCDIRPNVREDALLSTHIRAIDHLFLDDLWELLNKPSGD